MSTVLFKEQGWRWLKQQLEVRNAVLLCDANTRICLDHLYAMCPVAENTPVIEMPVGERFKTLKTCEMVWYQLIEHGADRHTFMINVGGGVVTDLGGFAASTFMRGIDFVHVPTSLLAMVDAAIGGKTGVDFGGLKNMVGTFAQPETVIVDPRFLKTLPSRQYRNGLAEVLKHAFISDGTLLDVMEADEDRLISGSIQVKLDVVNRDAREKNERKKLNFGHTLGHAIESHFLESDRPVLHGEAVAAGMIMEAFLSSRAAGLSATELGILTRTVDSVFPRIHFSSLDRKAVKHLMQFDKKNRDGHVRFVLLKRIGEVKIDRSVPEQLIDEAFAYYAQQA